MASQIPSLVALEHAKMARKWVFFLVALELATASSALLVRAPALRAAASARALMAGAAPPSWRKPTVWGQQVHSAVKRRPRHRGGGRHRGAAGPAATAARSALETTFEWRSEWFPLAPVRDLAADAPNKLTLLGMDLVAWQHAPSGSWRVFADLCPHRLVPLSEGRVEAGGVLQCAYHGWEFGPEGACTRIPQLGPGLCEDSPALRSPRACATSFPVQVAQGLLWVFPTADVQAAADKEPALIPELDDPSFVDATDFFVRDMPYSWEILVENLCDPSHIAFAHHALMNGADRLAAMDIDMRVMDETVSGFRAQKDPYPGGSGRYDVEFRAPCLITYTIVADSPRASHLGLGQYCVPTKPGWCRLLTRFPFRLSFGPAMHIIRATPRWVTHLSQNAVMDSDVVFLASQDEHRLHAGHTQRRGLKYYLPAESDAMVSALHRWIARPGCGSPPWLGRAAARSAGEAGGWTRPTRVPRRQGRDALLDRYTQHTDICRDCRRVHAALYAGVDAAFAVGVLLLACAAAGVGGVVASFNGFGLGRVVVAGLGAVLMAGKFAVRPLIARLECAPWPRRGWKAPTPARLMAERAR